MVCKSQAVRERVLLSEVLQTLNPRGLKGMFALIRGYIDDSYDKNVFALSCSLAEGKDWVYIGWALERCIERWNERLVKQDRKPLSRYHAAECSSLTGEFAGWSIDEQKELTFDLVNLLRDHPLDTRAFAIDRREFKNIFPAEGSRRDNLGLIYGLMTKFLVLTLDKEFCPEAPDSNISFIHDRCPYDGRMVDAFNQAVEDEGLEHRDCFTTIAPLRWQDCTPLQIADLLAYENFKDAQRILFPRRRRRSLELLIDLETFGGGVKLLGRDALLMLKSWTDATPQERQGMLAQRR